MPSSHEDKARLGGTGDYIVKLNCVLRFPSVFLLAFILACFLSTLPIKLQSPFLGLRLPLSPPTSLHTTSTTSIDHLPPALPLRLFSPPRTAAAAALAIAPIVAAAES